MTGGIAALAAILSVACSWACSSTPTAGSLPPAPQQAASAQAAPPSGAEWATLRWAPYDSLAHGFSLPLPEDPAWKVEDVKDAWLVASHAPTTTVVAARLLATDGLASRARCEIRARDLRPLPEREGAAIIEKRRVDLPGGFDTVLEVGLLPSDPGKPITGFVLAIGGWSKRCFAYALTTSAKGPGAEEAVADRLALFVERSFLRMRFGSDLTPLVPREKPPL